jgi:hypothetical protein
VGLNVASATAVLNLSSRLKKAAASTAATVQNQQDAYVAYEWQLSAKTYQDFQDYSKYLTDNLNKTTDPSQQLSIQKTLQSARSSYTSNEVQRQSMNVIEGTMTNEDKYGKLVDLYYQAADAGNYDLAQSLHSQLDSLSVTIQNEAEAKASAGRALGGQMATLRANSISDASDTLQSYMTELGQLYKSAGTNEFQKQIKGYAQELGLNPDAGFFDIYTNLAQQQVALYDNALATETDPSNIQKFQKARNAIVEGKSFELPGANGTAIKVSLQDLHDQADAARVGETLFNTTQSADGTVFTRNSKTGFVWGRDENGEYRQIPLYNPSMNTTSNVFKQKQVTDKNGNIVRTDYLDSNGAVVATSGKDGTIKGVNGRSINDAAKTDYKDLLKRAGIKVGGSGDNLFIQNTGNIKGFYGSPFPTGQNIKVYVDDSGQLQISNGENLYNLGFDQNGNFQGLQKSRPSAITQVNGTTARFNNPFISTLPASQRTPSTVGVVDRGLADSYLNRVKTFPQLRGVNPVLQNTPTSILQNAASIQAARQPIAPIVQPAAPAQIYQPAASGNILQPAANASALIGLPGQPKLTVKPVVQPKLVPAAPSKPAPPIKVAPVRNPRLV